MRIFLKRYDYFPQAFLAICLGLLLVAKAQAQLAVGEVSLVKGVVTANSAAHGLRTLDRGSEVFVEDEIETAQDSFVVVVMRDQGKLTLRPNTRLQVQAYNQQPGQEEERLKLIKGGLRAVTGLIGKARPDAVKLETRTTTIGIRGTDFIVIDCDPATEIDCNLFERELQDQSRQPPTRKRDNQVMPPVEEIINNAVQRKVDREPVEPVKNAVYFAVYDGKIYAITDGELIELEAVDACYRGEGASEFNCLLEIPKFLLHDVYLNVERDEFTLFNIFSDLSAEEAMCQLDWE